MNAAAVETVANVAVFLWGSALLTLCIWHMRNYWRHVRGESPACRIARAFILANVLSVMATLCFASNTILQVYQGAEDSHVNAITPWVAIGLRMLIFAPETFAVAIAERETRLQKEANDREVEEIKRTVGR